MVVATRRSGVIFLALQVAINVVILNGQPAAIFEGLQVAADNIAIGKDWAAIIVKLDVAIHAHVGDGCATPLLDLDAANHGGIVVDGDVGGSFSLNIATDRHITGNEGGICANLDIAVYPRAVERAALTIGDKEILKALPADRAAAFFITAGHRGGGRLRGSGRCRCARLGRSGGAGARLGGRW